MTSWCRVTLAGILATACAGPASPDSSTPQAAPPGQPRIAHEPTQRRSFPYTGPTQLSWLGDRPVTSNAGQDGIWQGSASVFPAQGLFPTNTGAITSMVGRLPPGVPGGYQTAHIGQTHAVVGDVDGDGLQDIAISYLGDRVDSETGSRTVVFPGPFLEDPDGTAVRLVTDSDVHVAIEAAWDFTPCDVDSDGLADLCSSRAIALSPPPFTQHVVLPDAAPSDEIQALVVDGAETLVRSTQAGTVEVLVAADLPTLTVQQTLAADGDVIALAAGDVTAHPGNELIAVVRDADGGHLVVFTTTPDSARCCG